MVRVLFVCTGNTCRSPMAAALFRSRRDRDYPHLTFVEASSAGISAVPGNAATQECVQAMDLWGEDLSGHRASPLTPARLEEADLVLAMAREHLLSIERISPGSLARTTTLTYLSSREPEVSAFLGDEPVKGEEELRSRIGEVLGRLRKGAGNEGYLVDMQSRSSDIMDPIGSPLGVYLSVAEEIDAYLQGAMRALFGRPLGGSARL